ncbi:MAG: hypothetical protein V3S39_03145 [Thermodesulfobacteriota bacterium]
MPDVVVGADYAAALAAAHGGGAILIEKTDMVGRAGPAYRRDGQ